MEQLNQMFKDKYGYFPIPDNSNPPRIIIERLKYYLFQDERLKLVVNNAKSNIGER